MDLQEHGRLEQILNQFLLKILHVILNSRVPSAGPANHGGGPIRKSDKWFNLALGDLPAAIDSPSLWNRNLMEPMVMDVILVQGPASHAVNETVLERWAVRYDHRGPTAAATPRGDASYKRAYKNSIVLMRSVHSMLRLLPAYKAFRKVCALRKKKNCDFDLIYKICSFSKPFSNAEEALMEKYSFIPVGVQHGDLTVSLSYRRDLSEFNFDSLVSYPPEIIGDYVGSPLTDPMRAFPSTSSERAQRPHSWTSGIHKELCSQQSRRYSGSPPLYKLPYALSPPFSSSPSPSPPTTDHTHRRMCSETSPMSIPRPVMARSPRFQPRNMSDPNRNSFSPLSSRNISYGRLSRESSSGSISMRRQDSLRYGELSSSPVNHSQKTSKGDSGRFSGLLSSSSSQRTGGLSWGSGRFSFHDDLGDSESFGPFIVDDEDPPENSVNPGALVHMLRTAPPLHRDTNYYASKTDLRSESVPVFIKHRKTSDALEELKAYIELKDLLLSKSNAPTVATENADN